MRRARTTPTGRPRRPLPTSNPHTAVVCLPADTATPDLPARAIAALTDRGVAAAGVLPHFLTRTRRTGKLIDRWQGLTSGGPITLLDLTAMRTNAVAAAAATWALWHQVVAPEHQPLIDQLPAGLADGADIVAVDPLTNTVGVGRRRRRVARALAGRAQH